MGVSINIWNHDKPEYTRDTKGVALEFTWEVNKEGADLAEKYKNIPGLLIGKRTEKVPTKDFHKKITTTPVVVFFARYGFSPNEFTTHNLPEDLNTIPGITKDAAFNHCVAVVQLMNDRCIEIDKSIQYFNRALESEIAERIHNTFMPMKEEREARYKMTLAAYHQAQHDMRVCAADFMERNVTSIKTPDYCIDLPNDHSLNKLHVTLNTESMLEGIKNLAEQPVPSVEESVARVVMSGIRDPLLKELQENNINLASTTSVKELGFSLQKGFLNLEGSEKRPKPISVRAEEENQNHNIISQISAKYKDFKSRYRTMTAPKETENLELDRSYERRLK